MGKLWGDPLRREFGVRGVLLGAPGLLWRSREVLLGALMLCLPVEMLVAFGTRGSVSLEALAEAGLSPLTAEAVLPVNAGVSAMSDVIRGNAASWAGYVLTDATLHVCVAAVVVTAAAHACIGRPVDIRPVGASVLRRRGRLAALVLVEVSLSWASFALILVAMFATLSVVSGGSVGVLVGLLLILLVGVLALIPLFLVAVLVFLAVPGVVVEGARPLPAMAKVLGLALRRSFPALGTGLVGLIVFQLTNVGAHWLFGPTQLGAAWNMPDWVAQGAARAVADAVGVSVVATLFMLRYLDLRVRREGLDRERLRSELHQAIPPDPGAR